MPNPHDASSLVELLRTRAQEAPGRCAYTFLLNGEVEEGHVTYGELDLRARAVAARLQALGARGERALLLYPAGLEYIAALFGCFYAGVTAVPAYPPRRNKTDPRLRSIVEDCAPALALTTRELLGEAEGLCAHTPELGGLRWLATEDVPAAEAEGWRDPEVGGETLAFLQYTSGSTAAPKGVMVSHGNLLHNFAVIEGFCGYTPETRSVIWLPPYHDMGLIGGILQPLFTGYWAALFSPVAFIQRPARWLEAISRYRATSSGGPNFAYELCVHAMRPEERAGLDLSHWEIAFNGAEPVRAETLRAFAEAFAPSGFRERAFFACYGLAEATLMVTGSQPSEPPVVRAVDAGALGEGTVREAEPEGRHRLVGSGRSAPSQRVIIVDPATLRESPSDRVGEVWVRGASVASGYWARPEATAETFGAYEAGTGEGPFLRTGDLGFLDGGELFITGRLKDLIVIRGRNHYPQDIEETAAHSHAGLRAGSGAAFSIEEGGEERLVVVQEVSRQAAAGLDVEEVADAIRRAVAGEHGVQVHAVAVARTGGVPKTTSGKVQRRACRTAFLAGELPLVGVSVREEAAHAAAAAAVPGLTREALEAAEAGERQTLLEAYLVERAAQVLAVDPAGVDREQPLVGLGLDSLRAMELKAVLEASLGAAVPVAALLEDRGIEELAAELLAAAFVGEASASGEAGADGGPGAGPLSFAQERLWFLDRLQPGSSAYNIPLALRISGALDAEVLRRVVGEVVRRQEALRTVFPSVEGVPVQVVRPAGEWRLPVQDVGMLPEQAREAAARQLAQAEARRPFELATGPLLRTRLIRLAADEHLLVVVMHHTIGDGASAGVLLRELSALYPALLAGEPSPLPPLPTRYARWAMRQRERLRGDSLERQLAYWRERLAGLVVLDLPTDRARPPWRGFRGAVHRFTVPATTAGALRAVARAEGATPFMALLAGFDLLLARYSGQEDVAVGTPASNRDGAEMAGVIGLFVNTLVLRTTVVAGEGFRTLLGRVRTAALEAFTHQDLPLERLVEEVQPHRDPSRNPLFQVMLAPQSTRLEPVSVGEATWTPEPVDAGAAIVDLTLYTWERSGGELSASLEYATDLFEAGTIERMAVHLVEVLRGVAAAPERAVAEVPLLLPAERVQLLEEWAATARAFPERCLHELFAEQAGRTPDAVAVAFEGESLTYAGLEARSDRLAHQLIALGVGPETRVGVCAERSLELVVALLGILKAGAAYVPLDPSYPAERLAYMLEDSGVPVLLAQERLLDRIPGHAARVVCLDRDAGRVDAERAEPLPLRAEPDSLAYVIYTSGSTGRPKGAMNAHRGIVNRLLWMQEQYGLTPGDVVLQKTPFSFDVSVWEIFWPLVSGARLVLARPEGHRDPAYLTELIERAGVSTAHFVPPMLQAFLDAGEPARCGSLRRVVCSGEALPYELTERFRAALPGVELHNLYGPTEAAVDVTYWACEARERRVVPIGRPVANTQLYVLDAGGGLVPVGVPGELYLGGVQVGRGYLGRAELTAERFVPDPFGVKPGARLYRTGDRVRWTAAGEVEFLGRADFQVKIRGFRIEPGEIEAALLEQAGVREAVVLAREGAPGSAGPRLVAYVVPAAGAGVTGAALREQLSRRLPEYMVPGAFVVLERLPLNANGKLDRHVLPVPESASGEGRYAAPRTAAEEVLAGIWAEVLKVERVGVEDGFFDLGGHSLLATQVASRVRRAFGVEVPLRALFEAPTVAGLAGRIEALRGAGASPAPPIEPVPRGGALPLSFAQQRLWVVDRLEPGSAAYNMAAALRLRGALDAAALRASLDALVGRHESLRTTLAERDGAPVQVIHPAGPAALVELDLGGLAEPAREAEAVRLARAESLRPFDLAGGPLLRGTLLRLSAGEHVLLFTLHHVVGDGWSLEVLVREISVLYTGLSRGEEPRLADLPVQYADYAVWQRAWLSGEVVEEQVGWWKDALAGAPPLLEISTDHPRAAGQSARAGVHRFTLPAEARRLLRALSRREGATLFMTILAGWQALLGRYAGQDDVVVGTPIAGRNRHEVEGLIGFFVNMLPLRADLAGDPTWRELLGRVREAALGAYAHQDLPFEKLVEELGVERSLTRTPVFQAIFELERAAAHEALALGGLAVETLGAGERIAKFDLDLTLREEDDSLTGALGYRAALFEAETVARMAGHLEALLEAMAAEPQRRLSEVSLLRGAEREQVVEAWNRTARPYPRGVCIHELFEAQVQERPDAAALVWGDVELTYAQLDARADRLARHLAGLGVGPESRVGVLLERGPELIVSILAVLKAGGCYVPLDPAYPAERLRMMLDDSSVRVLLSRDDVAFAAEAGGVPVVLLDEAAEELERVDDADALSHSPSPDNLAYIVYTSGSTGRPKGVMVAHRHVVQLAVETDYVRFQPGDRVAQASNASFDALTFEAWGALMNGATLVGIPRDVLLSPAAFRDTLRAQRITTLYQTTALLNQLSREQPDIFSPLREVLFGGQAVDADSVRRILEAGGPRRLLHMYGPTETTAWCSYERVEHVAEDAPSVTVGRATGNQRIYLLDAALEPVPVGVAGEAYVGGDGVVRGYLDRPELTAERFLPDPFGREPGARMYRTGDRLRWKPAGVLEFVGRVDEQVKIRGFRIEPGEVESAVAVHPAVREARVIVREDVPGEKRLVAYVVGDVEMEVVRAYLRRSLPEYMVPGAFVALARLPLTPNGKLDVKALPAPESASGEGRYAAPRTAAEEVLAGIWAEVLKVERVGVEDGFFDLGGHSLLATQVASRVRRAFGVEVPLRALFEAPTVAGLAGRIEALRGAGASPAPPIEPVPRGGALPLSFAQQRLWVVDRLEPGSAAYNMAAALRLRGALDAAALRASLDALVGRHESLRTTLEERDGAPVQVIHPAGPAALVELDLGGLAEPAREAEAVRLARAESLRPFDLAGGPLLRGTLLRLSAGEHVLLFTLHHVVGDGWSLEVLVREISVLYTGLSRGEEPRLADLPVQYADYAVWQRAWLSGEVVEEQVGWWKDALAGAPPLLEISTDHPRAAGQSARAGVHRFTLPAEATRRLRGLSRREGATLFMTILAGWQALLGRYAGQDDVVVGTPIAGRNRHEVEGLIGFFVNMLPLRARLGSDPTWTELLARTRATALGAYEHQELPFERLVEELGVERSLTHTPVFQVSFALQESRADRDLSLGSLELEPFGSGAGVAKFDLELTVADEPGMLDAALGYRGALFEVATVARMAGHLEALLEAMAAEPQRRLSEVSLLRGEERAQVLEAWNATAAALPRACVHELFSEHAARTPDAVAVVSGEETVSYAELERRSDGLAQLLRQRGVGTETRVGMVLERGVDAVLAMLGILKAGGAYVPLAPSNPAERLREVFADAGVSLVLTDAAAGARLPAEVESLWLDDAGTADALAALPESAPRVASHPGQLAYVIYTSGSTGRPKGVAVAHESVVRLVRSTNYVPFGPAERIAHASNLAFDAAVFEIWGALLNGGSLAVIEREVTLSPADFAATLREREVSTLFLTTALFNRVAADEPGAFARLRHLLFGGEAVDPQSVRRVLETGAPGRLLHVYGPTETTTYASWQHVRGVAADAATVPIGGPLGNTTLYVLDGGGEPLPAGVPGELYIGGLGTARGYLGQAAMTAERFVPDAFGAAGARLYRTGDRVRWTAAGEIEYLGRMDAQVKIRGFRIEPGEVEAVLSGLAEVGEAFVTVREDAAFGVPGQKRLVAYLVPAEGVDLVLAEVRAHLAARLPDYMVPGAFVELERLPLNANGKVDRSALPAPEQGVEVGYVAPRTPTEELLAGIWAEVLGLAPERVGAEDGFFELGGHSLLATQVVSRARRSFGVEMPLRALFETPTVAGLAACIETLRSAGTSPTPPIERASREDPLPLSFAQQRLWVVDRLEPGSAAYNMAGALRLRGSLDAAALHATLGELVRRHEALRTTFAERGGAPVQVVHRPAPVPLPLVDLRGAADAVRLAQALAGEEALRPFDLARGPLLRSMLLRLGEADHVLLFTLHHVVGDGWSMEVLVREVSALYAAFGRGEPSPLPELPVQYADYATWQREWLSGEVLETHLSYWRERLGDAPPLLEIPTDRPRTAAWSPRAGTHRFTLPAKVSMGLRDLSRRAGATLFMTTLAAWQALLGRYAGVEDVVAGSPIAGRTRRETEGLIGFFVNMLALRGDLAGDPTWSELLKRVAETALGAYAHQELPFERLVEELGVERSLTHTPVFQVTFALNREAAHAGLDLGELAAEPFGAGEGVAGFDLALALQDSGEELSGTLTYRAALFEAETVARMAGHLEVVLESMAASPQGRLSAVSLLREAERAQLLADSHADAMGLPLACVHELFSEQAARTPGAPAIAFGDETLTYAELERRANRLAHHLRRRGVGLEVRVGICLERGVEMVAGVLGILKAGGAYVPLDPAYPAERLAYTLGDSGASLLLTQGRLADALPAFAGEVVCLDADREAIAAESDEAPESGAALHDAAYVIYTSGSMGRPKGVVVEHASLAGTLLSTRTSFGMQAGEVMPAMASFAFDIWGFEVFAPLLAGGQVRLLPQETVRDVERLVEELATVDAVHAVPALMREVAARVRAGGGSLPRLRRVFVGGDAVAPDLLEQMRAAFPAAQVWAMYGPTETTMVSAAWGLREGVRPGWQVVGRALPGEGLYVCDGGGGLLPSGVPGELWIGGVGVARGYLRRPELTAEKFVPDAFSGAAGARLYRTGDRVRRRGDGELEFLGRTDAQVKVRGFRIEPGEVEAALLEQAGVHEAVVVVREDAPGQKRLVGYVVPQAGPELSGAGLRASLSSGLPEHMVPGAIVVLERLPLNANGKVDRRALPAPELGAEAEHVAPRTAAEEVLAGIWAEVLGLAPERVGAEDGFFELGGHSLLATQVVSRARQAFGVEVPLRALFEAPTVAALAGRIEALRSAGTPPAPPMERVSREGVLPLSFAQQRLWVVDRLEPGSAAYNMPFALRLRGTLDVAALRASIGEVVRRHEALRTTFAERDGVPVQVIHPAAPVPLPVLDLCGLPGGAREPQAERLARAEALRPFDLARGPLLRSTLVRLGEREHVLLLTLHHVVSDGWSMDVLVRDLSALYAAHRGGTAHLPELPVQYADYAVWQRAWLSGEVMEEQIRFWNAELGGAPPLLEISTDHPRSVAVDARGESHGLPLPAEVSHGLRALSRREGATLFMTLLAGWQALLGRYAGQEDVVVGTPIAGRTRRETEGLIGFFVNMLALRADLSGDPTWRELLVRVRETALGAYDHQELPFERLVDELGVERSLTHSPVFQVIFALNRAGGRDDRLRLGETALERFGAGERFARFDLGLTILDEDEGLGAVLAYRTGLFEAETIARMAGHLEVLLEAMAAHPGQRLSEVPLLRGAEREQLLHVSHGANTGYTGEACLHEMVHAQVQRTPDAPALRFEGQRLDYAELYRRSCRLANLLRREGVGPEVRVAICMDPAPEMIVAVLGVMLAGGAYLPLDPELPAERRAYMIRDATPVLMLTQAALAERLEGCGLPLFLVDAEAGRIAQESETAPATGVVSDNLAYVIYTSGSTGRPKGVLVEHRAVANTIRELVRIYDSRPGDRNLLYAPLHFDASVGDMFIALSSGAELVVAPRRAMLPGEDLLRLLREQRITHVKTMQSALAATPVEDLPELRTLVAGGDRLPGEQLRRWSAEGRKFFNGYGATEASIRNTSSAYTAEDGDPPIGRTFGNTQLYVLDRWLEPAPIGVAGELYIGGVGVVRGYMGRAELTAERFLPDPHRGVAGARLYRTGDLGRRRADGEIEFLGRADHQVKVRGYRVELGEIEATLRAHERVREAVVLLREDVPGQQRLVAYVVPEAGVELAAAELREHVAEQVPEYMVPGALVVLEELPVMASGKVDRRLLPAPDSGSEKEPVGPRTVEEELLAGIWAEVLGTERVGVEESFFELGGHSLLATQVVSRARQVFGVELPLRALFEAPTVTGLAGRIEALRGAGTPPARPIERVPREGPLPLSFAQQRLWLVDRMEPDSPAYNMAYALRLRGVLDTAALRTSLDALARRHEALRTTFAECAGAPVQVVHPPAPVALEELDLRDLPEAERETEAERLAGEEAMRPFDLARGPLLRSTLLRLGDDDHVLLFTLHHIVSDGWSRGVLVREVSALYAAACRGEAARLPELEIQYADYAVWQRDRLCGEGMEVQLAYWRERLAGAPPLLEIPTDRPRAVGRSARAGSHAFRLTPELSRGLRALSRQEGTTLFMTVMAAWQALLGRYAGQDDVVVGSPIAGRTRHEVEGLIGFFVNMLCLRADLSGDPTWSGLLGRVREAALGAYAHQDVPIERLVEELVAERSLTHAPLFQVAFALDRSGEQDERPSLGDVKLEPFGSGEGVAKFDLFLTLLDEPEALGGALAYREGLFEAETAARMAGHLAAVLEAMVADPSRRLSGLSLLRGAERARVLEAWNDTAAGIPHACIHELFAGQAARTPDALAVRSGGETLTYAELERRANRIAHLLRGRGVGPETRVGLCMERGVDAVAALLGIVTAGGAYVPLDPSNPTERLRQVFSDAGVELVLTHTAAGAQLPGEVDTLRLDDPAVAAELAGLPESAPAVAADPAQLAYVVYTSGSTGLPKGVAVGHRSVVRLVRETRYVPFGPAERIAQVSNLAFDAAVFEIWGALLNGGSLEVVEREVMLSPADFAAALRERQVSVLFLTTALFNRVAADEPGAFAPLRHLLFGGEAVDPQSVRRVLETGAPGRLLHVYGPTETTTYASWQHVRSVAADAATVPIGGPLGNTTLYVLDRGGEPLPAGVPGELYIGGLGTARGYLGQAAMTAERFVPDAFGAAGARLYRTGDRVRWTAAGEIEYLGRMDAQVKVRGFRIEPGEIEALLTEQSGVREAVVVVREDTPGEKRLVACVVAAEGEAPSAAELRGRLSGRLPEYMVPSAFVVLERLPLTSNGKVDRRALLTLRPTETREYVAPRTEMEALLCRIWIEVLDSGEEARDEPVGIHDSFFEMGGHSLLATQVVTRIGRELGIDVPLQALFESPTVAELATRVEDLFILALDASEFEAGLSRLELVGDPTPGK